MENFSHYSSIKGKVVAISGGSSGIGEAIARHLAKRVVVGYPSSGFRPGIFQ